MKINCKLYIVSFFIIFVASCSIMKPKVKETVRKDAQKVVETPSIVFETQKPVLKIGDEVFDKKAFKYLWESSQKMDSVDAMTNLDLIIQDQKFALEAKRRGFDTTQNFKLEIASFEENIARSYLTDSATIYSLMKETYNWMKSEVHAAHILIQVGEMADPTDTLIAYNQIIEIKNKTESGESFEELAKQFSADRKTAIKGGDLGFFGALNGIYPITKAAYSLNPNQVSNPIRTKSGYHLIKLIEKRPSLGEVKIAHILVKVNPNDFEKVKLKAWQKIDSAYNLLKGGESFRDVAKLLSEDITSKNKGGLLPNFYGIGKLETNVEKAAFALKGISDFSEPVLSNYGWHIVQLINKKELSSFEEMNSLLMEKATTDSRGEIVKASQINKLKKIGGYSEFSLAINEAFLRSDTNLISRKWKYNFAEPILDRTIFAIAGNTRTVKEFFDFIIESQSYFRFPAGATGANLMRLYLNKFSEKALKEFSLTYLIKENEQFGSLVNSYKTDILKNDLLNALVFDKSSDTTLQRFYYEKNQSNFLKNASIRALVITSNKQEIITKFNEITSQPSPYRLRKGLQPIRFENNSVELNNDAKKSLLGLVSLMRKNPAFIVEIGGHASVLENDTVSQARLRATISFLTKNSLPITRIIENDFGKNKPIGETIKNGRVSIEFLTVSKSDLEKLLSNPKENILVSIQEKTFFKGMNPVADEFFNQLGTNSSKTGNTFNQITVDKIIPAQVKPLKECRGAVYAEFQKSLMNQLITQLKSIPVEMDTDAINQIVKNNNNNE